MTAFERIMTQQVPDWAAKFDAKNKDYNSATTGWEPHTFLGVKGQFADVWRKVGKLKKALWDEEALTGEQPREIIQDLISHLFLTLDLMGPEPMTAGPADIPFETDSATMPDGGAREGAQRLGISEADWERIKEWANDVHNTGKPEILEKHGYFLQTNQPEEFSQPCRGCTWTRTLEEGRVEYHIYKGSCIYRIRQRKVRP